MGVMVGSCVGYRSDCCITRKINLFFFFFIKKGAVREDGSLRSFRLLAEAYSAYLLGNVLQGIIENLYLRLGEFGGLAVYRIPVQPLIEPLRRPAEIFLRKMAHRYERKNTRHLFPDDILLQLFGLAVQPGEIRVYGLA